jgi:EAL domain-containing protein (putative c-di-GMP-specific phosphodiesterase class I)
VGHEWPEALEGVLEYPHRVRPFFQPIVDLERGAVCGYEALARFDGGPPPDEWFAAAARLGLEGPLEALMVRDALDARAGLADECFLAVNVSPQALLSDEVAEAFAEAGRLDGVIVEVTEQSDADLRLLRTALDALRERGAQVAVDDAGAGYSSLGRISALRPQYVKVDRALVADLDVDTGKAAIVEALCELAGRIDAWIVAEGVERLEELDALLRLRVPLGQGYAFGRPAAEPGGVQPGAAERIREHVAAPAREPGVAALVEAVPTLPERTSKQALTIVFARRPRPDFVALVDRAGRPRGLVRRDDHDHGRGFMRNFLPVTATMSPATIARRAMARPPARRFDPMVFVDDAGCYGGLLRLERVVEALAD